MPITEWIKEHPYETGGLALLVAGLAYILLFSGGSSQANPATANAAAQAANAADYYQAQMQIAQLNAQTGAANLGAQTQQQQNSLQAQVANNETTAQLQAQENQNEAAIQAAKIQAGVTNDQTAAQVSVAAIQGDVQNTSTQAQVKQNEDNLAAILGLVSSQDSVQKDQINSQVIEQANNDHAVVDLGAQQYNYLTNAAGDSTKVNLAQLGDETSLINSFDNNQYNLSSSTIKDLTANGGLSRNNVQLGEVLSAIEAALGQGGPSTALASQLGTISGQGVGKSAYQFAGAGAQALSQLLTGLFA